MSTREKNFIPERGMRFKLFRQEVLKMEQKDLMNETGKSQSTISMVEKGQYPPQELLDYAVSKGLNLNWLFHGKGDMKLSSAKEPGESYDVIRGYINHASSSEPMDMFISSLQKLVEAYYKVRGSSEITKEEELDLYRSIIEKCEEQVEMVKGKY